LYYYAWTKWYETNDWSGLGWIGYMREAGRAVLKILLATAVLVGLLAIAQIPLGASRHDTLSSPCILLVGQHGATRSSRKARQARFARHVFRDVAAV